MNRDLFGELHEWRYLVHLVVFTLVPRLPWSLSRFLAYAIGLVAWWVDAEGRCLVRANLGRLLPRRARESIDRAVRRNYGCFAMGLVDALHMHHLPATEFRPPRLELIDPFGAVRQGPMAGPALVCTVHMNWELTLALGKHLPATERLVAVALPSGDARIDQLFESARKRIDCETIFLDSAPMAALRALRDQRVLGIVAERDYQGNGMVVDVAGHPLRMPLGPAALSVQTGAAIVPVMLARRGLTRLAVIFGRPLRPDTRLPKHQQLLDLTRRLGAVFGRFLRAAPAQWIAFHRAWVD